jgi:hypothetical protein
MDCFMKICSSSPLALQTERGTRELPADDRSLVDRIKVFFRCFPGCTESHPRSAQKLLKSSPVSLSSVSTQNGPWVYTVVPWED